MRKKINIQINNLFSKYNFCIMYLFFCFFKNLSLKFRQYKLLTYVIFAISLLILIFKVISNYKTYFNRKMIIPIMIICSALISIIVNKQFDISNLKLVLIFIFNFFIIMPEDDDFDINGFTRFSHVSAILLFVYTLLSWLDFFINNFNYSFRPNGLYTLITNFSQLVFCGFITAIFSGVQAKNKKFQMFFCFIAIIQFITLLCLQQRAMLFGLVISVMFIIIFLVRYKSNIFNRLLQLLCMFKYYILLFFIIMLVLYLLGVLNFNVLYTKIVKFTFSGRLQIWKVGFYNMILNKNYIFGSSFSLLPLQWENTMNFFGLQFFNLSFGSNYYKLAKCCAVHSVVFYQLFIHGIIGMILLIVFFVIIVKSILHCLLLYKNNMLPKNYFSLIVCTSFMCLTSIFSAFFDVSILFDIVYMLNLHFFIFAGAILKLSE